MFYFEFEQFFLCFVHRGEHGLHGQQLLELEQWWQCKFAGFIVANENVGGGRQFGQYGATT